MTKSLRMATLIVCVLAVGTLPACGKESNMSDQRQISANTQASTAPNQPPDPGVENERVSRMTDEVTKVAGTDWASVLGGLAWDAQERQLVIYLVDNSKADALQASIEKAVGAVQGDYTHRFVRVDRSFQELRNLATAAMADRREWAGDFADDIILVAPDRAINGLRVAATGHVAELKDQLKARVGGVPVAAEQGVRGSAK